MKYYSTNGNAPMASLKDAVIKGLAPDGGLYMPERISLIPKAFFNNLEGMTFQEIAYVVANTLFGEDVESDRLKAIVYDALNFPIPLKKVEDNIYVLELFHGPTLAFKDVGARFMARLLGYFNEKEQDGRGHRRKERRDDGVDPLLARGVVPKEVVKGQGGQHPGGEAQ